LSAEIERALPLFGEGHAALQLGALVAAVQPMPTRGAEFSAAEESAPDAGAAAAVALLRSLLVSSLSPRERAPRRLAELAVQVGADDTAPPDRALLLASALGGLHHLDFGPTPFVRPLEADLGPIVCVRPPEEGIESARHVMAAQSRKLVAELMASEPAFDLARLAFDEAWNLLLANEPRATDAATRERLLFSILQSRDLLLAAIAVVGSAPPRPAGRRDLGELLDRDHCQRIAALGHAAPRTTALRQSLLDCGALAVWWAGGRLAALVRGEDPEREVFRLRGAAGALGAAAWAFSVAAVRSA
jgi:hypothetical protein